MHRARNLPGPRRASRACDALGMPPTGRQQRTRAGSTLPAHPAPAEDEHQAQAAGCRVGQHPVQRAEGHLVVHACRGGGGGWWCDAPRQGTGCLCVCVCVCMAPAWRGADARHCGARELLAHVCGLINHQQLLVLQHVCAAAEEIDRQDQLSSGGRGRLFPNGKRDPPGFVCSGSSGVTPVANTRSTLMLSDAAASGD